MAKAIGFVKSKDFIITGDFEKAYEFLRKEYENKLTKKKKSV